MDRPPRFVPAVSTMICEASGKNHGNVPAEVCAPLLRVDTAQLARLQQRIVHAFSRECVNLPSPRQPEGTGDSGRLQQNGLRRERSFPCSPA